MASKPDSRSEASHSRRKGRSKTSDGSSLDADDATNNRRNEYEAAPLAQGHKNSQGSTLPTDNTPPFGYTNDGQRAPFYPTQMAPYGSKYMTGGYHPAPPSIATSNSGNSSSESATGSYNQSRVSVGRGAAIRQETNLTSVPVMVNVQLNVPPAGPPHVPYANSVASQSSSAHRLPDPYTREIQPTTDVYSEDSQYRPPREKDSHRQRPRKPRGPYTHNNPETLYEEDEDVDHEASGRDYPRHTHEQEPYRKQSEQRQRPRDPEPTATISKTTYVRDVGRGDADYDRRTSSKPSRDSYSSDRHRDTQTVQMQRVESSSFTAEHRTSRDSRPAADETHRPWQLQTREPDDGRSSSFTAEQRPSRDPRPTADETRRPWQIQTHEPDGRNDEETPHGSPDTLNASRPRRPKDGGRSSETALDRRWPGQEDDSARQAPLKVPFSSDRQMQPTSSDALPIVQQEYRRVSQPLEKERAQYQVQVAENPPSSAMPVYGRKDSERYRDPKFKYSDMNTNDGDWPRTSSGQPPRTGPLSNDHFDSDPISSSASSNSRTYSSSPPSSVQSPWQDKFDGRKAEHHDKSIRNWDGPVYPTGDDNPVQWKGKERVDPVNSTMKPMSGGLELFNQPDKTSAAVANPPLRRPEGTSARNWSDPAYGDHNPFKQNPISNTSDNHQPQPHRRLTNPGDTDIPSNPYTSRPPPPVPPVHVVPVPPRQGPYGPFPNVPNVRGVISSLPPANQYENELVRSMAHQATMSGGPSYPPPPAYHAHSHSSHLSVSTLPEKYTSIGYPSLFPVQRKQENEQGWIRRRPSASTLEGHIPLYMSSKIVDPYTMPLWYPSPKLAGRDQTMRGIEVGDIGYLDDESGEFHTIFNIFFSHDENANRGAFPPPPSHFQRLHANPQEMLKQVEIQKRHYFASSNITRTADQYSRSNEDYNFVMQRKQGRSGAICVLPHGGLSCTLRRKFFQMPHVKQYFRENAPSWYQHAGVPHILPNLVNGSLLFVHGTHNARTWGIATFMSKNDTRPLQNITFSRGDFSRYEYQWERFGEGWKTSIGPASQELASLRPHEPPRLNQCVGIIASAVQLDDSTWQTYFAGNIRSPAFRRPRDTGLGRRILSRMSSISSIRVEHHNVPRYLESLTEHQFDSRTSNDWDLLRMEMN